MDICNKVENEDSIHSRMKTFLPTCVHVNGTCTFFFFFFFALCGHVYNEITLSLEGETENSSFDTLQSKDC